jgi:quercetin dioxygenase-like cupin family protein
MPELGIQKHFLDQMVTEGDGYHEYDGKVYRLTEGDGLHEKEWFEWSFEK